MPAIHVLCAVPGESARSRIRRLSDPLYPRAVPLPSAMAIMRKGCSDDQGWFAESECAFVADPGNAAPESGERYEQDSVSFSRELSL